MVVLAFVVPLALVVRGVAKDRAEHAAELEARSLAAVLAGSRDPAVLRPIVESTDAGSPRPATVFLPDGTVLGDQTPAGAELAQAQAGQALTAPVGGGDEAVLVPVQSAEGTAVARVIVPEDQLQQGVARAWWILAALSVALIAMAVLLADRLARALVRAVDRLQDTARRLREGERDARADVADPPELAEVAVELNRLADVIDDLLAAERESVADLSHRLRTPLTALRLDVEGLPDDADRARLLGEVEALELAVDRQIRVAREGRSNGDSSTVDVSSALRDRMAFWSVLAADQHRELTVDVPDAPALVHSSRDDLAAAVDALVGNVFAHTPAGTALRVSVAGDDDGVTVLVADDGAGLADDRATERGRSGRGSTGLGLDIARQVAEASGGSLHLESAPGEGTRVWLRLGAAVSRPAR
jgi:signal transduction histidine kinase